MIRGRRAGSSRPRTCSRARPRTRRARSSRLSWAGSGTSEEGDGRAQRTVMSKPEDSAWSTRSGPLKLVRQAQGESPGDLERGSIRSPSPRWTRFFRAPTSRIRSRTRSLPAQDTVPVRRLAPRRDDADPRGIELVAGGEPLRQLLLRRRAEQQVVPRRPLHDQGIDPFAREPERGGDVLGLLALEEGVADAEDQLVRSLRPPPHLCHGSLSLRPVLRRPRR